MITVIIPSKGRSSLNRAINSLIHQTNPFWNCYVILDGIDVSNKLDDHRVLYYEIPKLGNNNNGAGLVRNKGIEISSSKWIAFLDDDDTFSPNYIEDLYNIIEINPDIDVCIFKMTYSPDNEKVLPPEGCSELLLGQVGISFALKKNFIDKYNLKFNNSNVEDFEFLIKCRDFGAKIYFSEKINYFVDHGFI